MALVQTERHKGVSQTQSLAIERNVNWSVFSSSCICLLHLCVCLTRVARNAAELRLQCKEFGCQLACVLLFVFVSFCLLVAFFVAAVFVCCSRVAGHRAFNARRSGVN